MKNAILIFILCILCITIQAQEKIKQTEMGFTFRNLDNFGLCLKKGSNKFMWRFNTVILSSSKNKENNDTITNTSGGFGFSIGHQFVKQLRDNFEFYTGYDFEYSHSKMKTVTKISLHDQPYEKSTTNLYGINMILGANYIIKNQIVVGIEILPGFSYYKTKLNSGNEYYIPNLREKETEDSGYKIGFTNSAAKLTIAYRF